MGKPHVGSPQKGWNNSDKEWQEWVDSHEDREWLENVYQLLPS